LRPRRGARPAAGTCGRLRINGTRLARGTLEQAPHAAQLTHRRGQTEYDHCADDRDRPAHDQGVAKAEFIIGKSDKDRAQAGNGRNAADRKQNGNHEEGLFSYVSPGRAFDCAGFIRATCACGKTLVKLYRDFINAVNQKTTGVFTILPLAPIHARNGTIGAAEVISSRAGPPTRPRDDPFVGRLPSLMENPYVVYASAASLFP
jgi:hypothetical protein